MVTQKNVDFSNVKDGGNFNRNRIPAGDYLATIIKVEDAVSQKDDVFQYLFSIKVNKHPSRVLPYYCKLQENQLWKLRNLLIAAGRSVPKTKLRLNPEVIVGKMIGITVEDGEYEGKEQSDIAGVFPAAELADGGTVMDDDDDVSDDDDVDTVEDLLDDEPEAAPVVADDDEEEEEEPESAYADLDRTALKAELKKRDSAFVARKSQTDDDLRTLLDDDDTAKAEAKAKAAAAAKPSTRRRKAAAPAAVTDDELDELDIDDL